MSRPMAIEPAIFCSPIGSPDLARTTYFTSPGSRKQTLAVSLGPNLAEYSLRLVPNPSSPPKDVTWGEQTTDEMCVAFLVYTADKEHLTKGISVPDFFDVIRQEKRGESSVKK